MFCEACNKQYATVFVTRIVNDATIRFDLCAPCAEPLGESFPLQSPPVPRPASSVEPDPLRPVVVDLPETITVRDLATTLRIRPFHIIGLLMEINVFASLTHQIEFAAAAHVCSRCNVAARKAA